MPAADSKLRLAIVGTGDVAYRHYLPALTDLAGRVAITAFVRAFGPLERDRRTLIAGPCPGHAGREVAPAARELLGVILPSADRVASDRDAARRRLRPTFHAQ